MVKKRVRRAGGEEVGWEVSALRSHWRTEILFMFGSSFQFGYVSWVG